MISRFPHRVFSAAQYALPGTRHVRAVRGTGVKSALAQRRGYAFALRFGLRQSLPTQLHNVRTLTTKDRTAAKTFAALREIVTADPGRDPLLAQLLELTPKEDSAGRQALQAIEAAMQSGGE